jgi:type II secretory pathway component GspD/PulD (secretin)
MIFCYLLAAHLLNGQEPVSVELKINHRRASQVLEIMERSEMIKTVNLNADDLKGCLNIQASPEVVNEVKGIVKLIDVPRTRLSVKVTIDSSIDKEVYQVSTKIFSRQRWTTGDGDTGINLAIEPRLNPDKTVTLLFNCERKGSSSLNEVLRMKLGSSHTFIIGSQTSSSIRLQDDGKISRKTTTLPEPKVTIRIDS